MSLQSFLKGNIKKRLLIFAIEVVIDTLNDYVAHVKTGAPYTPFKHEKDRETNVVDPDLANTFAKKIEDFF